MSHVGGLSLEEGSTIDHFQLLRRLGEGGLGQVFLAYDTQLHRKVALKVVHPTLLQTRQHRERFLFEARTTAQFNHPSIVTIYSVGEADGQFYLALEYLKGQTLAARLQEGTPQLSEFLKVGLETIQALSVAHERGILHLDLKPENVFLTQEGKACVLDFGLAKLRPLEEALPLQHLVEQSSLLKMQEELSVKEQGIQGTPAYMAPEQWAQQAPTEATDMWAWGIMMLEVWRGSHPFEHSRREPMSIGFSVLSGSPVPGIDALDTCPPILASKLKRCLAKAPQDRPSAKELEECIQALLEQPKQTGEKRPQVAPFRGLKAFTESHADYFYGRDADIAQFFELMQQAPVIPVVGPSGAGKSSLMRAGIVPRLRRDGWKLVTIRPGARPWIALVKACIDLKYGKPSAEQLSTPSDLFTEREEIDAFGGYDEDAPTEHQLLALAPQTVLDGQSFHIEQRLQETKELTQRFRQHPEALGYFLQELAVQHGCRIFLLIDQLEELLTMVPDEDEQNAFLRTICAAADAEIDPIRVSFTLRHEFLPRMHGSPELRMAMRDMLLLWQPGPQALRDLIERPITRVGYQLDDPSLVQEMIEAVQDEQMGLPLLQFTLHRLWLRRDRDQHLLQRSAYEAMGGLGGALAQHADGVIDRMSDIEKRVARELVLRLVTTDNTRRIIRRSQLIDGLPEDAIEVIRQLIDARLLSVRQQSNTGDAEPGLELAHESLLHNWKRCKEWIERGREDLAFMREVEESARLWERRGANDDETWQGAALHEALRHLARVHTVVPPLVERFLTTGKAREDKALKRTRRLRWAGMLTLLLIATLSSTAAWLFAQQHATEQRQRAQIQLEGAKTAHQNKRYFEARARLRSAFEVKDSAQGRWLWWYLKQQPLQWQHKLGAVTYEVKFSPNGKQIAVASQDKSVYLFNVQTKASNVLRGHEDQVLSIAYGHDGKTLFSGAWNGELFRWNLHAPGFTRLTNQKGFFYDLARHPTKPLIGGGDSAGSLLFWRGSHKAPERFASRQSQRFRAATFHPTQPWLYCYSSTTKWLQVWNYQEKPPTKKKIHHRHKVRSASLTVSSDGKVLAFVNESNAIQTVNAGTLAPIRTFAPLKGKITGLAFGPKGDWLVSLNWRNQLMIWDAKTGRVRQSLKGVKGGGLFVATAPNNRHVATASFDNVVRLWDITTKPLPLSQLNANSHHNGLAIHPDGKTIISLGSHKTLEYRNKESGHLSRVLRGHKSTTWDMLIFPKQQRIYTASADYTVGVWDTKTNKLIERLQGHTGEVHSIAATPDGRYLLTGSYDGRVMRWDRKTLKGTTLLTTQPKLRIRDIALHPNGTLLAIGGSLKKIQLFNAKTGAFVRYLAGHSATVNTLLWSKKGDVLYSGSDDHNVRAWNMTDNAFPNLGLAPKQHKVVAKHGARIYAVSLHPNETRLASAGADGLVHVWDLRKGTSTVLVGHHNEVNGVAFFDNGKMLATVGDDGTTRTWWLLHGQPHWWSAGYLPDTMELLTHRGWQTFDGTPSNKSRKRWQRAIATHGRHASIDTKTQRACIATHDQHLEMWNTKSDTRLFRQARRGIRQLIASGRRCVILALPIACTAKPHQKPCTPTEKNAKSADMYKEDGAFTKLHQAATTIAKAQAPSQILLVTKDAIHTCNSDGETLKRDKAGQGITAVLQTPTHYVLGFSNGNIECLPRTPNQTRHNTTFEALPASPLVRLAKGPMGTIIAGFASGFVGVWDLKQGTLYHAEQLHGQAKHIAYKAGTLYVASELGDAKRRDLSVFNADYCELMRDIWKHIHVRWDNGRPSLISPPSRHKCTP